jgi:hypothetical protein
VPLLPIFLILAGGLVGYRLGKMLSSEEGPFSLFALLRGNIDPLQKTWLGRGMNCPYCISFWASLLGVCLLALPLGVFNPAALVAYWLAASGMASLFLTWEYKS